MIRRLMNKLKMQKQYGGKDKFEKALQQQGLTADKYKKIYVLLLIIKITIR